MRKSARSSKFFLGITLACFCLSGSSKVSKPLELFEAEILIYLTENGDFNRQQGRDIEWTREPCRDVPEADFYCFWVTGFPAPPEGGSVTIGPYAVDRRSATVWRLGGLKEPDKSREVVRVQELIRRAHNIEAELVLRREEATRKALLE